MKLLDNPLYVSKGSYTLGFTQRKNFQSCTCLLLPWPISSLSIFGGFGGSFASVCSHPGVPITFPLFLAASEHVLHLFVFVTSSALPVTHCVLFDCLGHYGEVHWKFSRWLAVLLQFSYLFISHFDVFLWLPDSSGSWWATCFGRDSTVLYSLSWWYLCACSTLYVVVFECWVPGGMVRTLYYPLWNGI